MQVFNSRLNPNTNQVSSLLTLQFTIYSYFALQTIDLIQESRKGWYLYPAVSLTSTSYDRLSLESL